MDPNPLDYQTPSPAQKRPIWMWLLVAVVFIGLIMVALFFVSVGRPVAFSTALVAPNPSTAPTLVTPQPDQPDKLVVLHTAPAQGQILDLSADPVIAKMPVKRISIDIDAVKAQDAIGTLPLGKPISIRPPRPETSNRLLTLHLKDAPYMEAVAEIYQQLHVRTADSVSSEMVLTYAALDFSPHWCIAGPFAVVYNGISREISIPVDTKTQPASGGPVRRNVLHLELLHEPGMDVIQSMQDVQCPGLQDDKHQTITIDNTGQNHAPTLVFRDNPGRRIPLLKGTIDARIGRTVPIVLTNLTQPHKLDPLEGMTVETSALVSQDARNRYFWLTVTYTRGDMGQDRWDKLVPVLPTANLQSGYRRTGGLLVRDSNTVADQLKVRYTLIADPGQKAPPATATLEVRLGMLDVRVPFEFKDVEIP